MSDVEQAQDTAFPQDSDPANKIVDLNPGGKYGVNFGTHDSPKELLGGSAYTYFLVPNVWSFLVALTVVAFQLYLFWLMWTDAEPVSNQDFRTSNDHITGLVGAVFMLALRVLPHIGRGMELLSIGLGLTFRFAHLPEFRKKSFDLKLTFAAIIDLLVGASCVAVGIRFSLNKAAGIRSTITSATVAVFIEAIDEHMYSFLEYWGRPGWVRWAESQIEKNYGSRPE
eukprot:CAMPEP_0113536820 /NCGR_PEP_ID=MMETSP0015_2-20120614/6476_1 /TAXON_ID=2838 /ORGANISM="Odontella" /LENGTH=225 /DNA_ID=CAMNT_0000436233 /DNA_START=87 /DNA_END=765 /DNA_ORIENTATION=- /assembly_acc=CAM_ASM_000160